MAPCRKREGGHQDNIFLRLPQYSRQFWAKNSYIKINTIMTRQERTISARDQRGQTYPRYC